MQDNEFENDVLNDVLKAIPEAQLEMAIAEDAAAGIIDGLTFLRSLDPQEKFNFAPIPGEGGDFKILTTLTTTETTAAPLQLRVNARGEIFSNLPGDYISDEWTAEQDRCVHEFNDAAERTQDDDLKKSAADHDRRLAQHKKNMVEMGLLESRTDSTAALKEVARQAVLQGKISSGPGDTRMAATPAQQAILDGLHQGFIDKLIAEGELTYAWVAAENIDAGLSALARSSDTFTFEARAEGNTIVILTKATGPASTIIVTPAGKIKIGTQEYDAFDKAAAAEILTDIARQAALNGQVSAISDELSTSTDTLETAVRDGLRASLEEVRFAKEKKMFTEMAARAEAEDIVNVLKALDRESGGAFTFKEEYFECGQVRLTLNPGAATQQYIMIDANAKVCFGSAAAGKEYNARDDRERLTEDLRQVARAAVFQGKISGRAKKTRSQPSC